VPVWPPSAGEHKPGGRPGGSALCRCHQLRGTPTAQPGIYTTSAKTILQIAPSIRRHTVGLVFPTDPQVRLSLVGGAGSVPVLVAIPQPRGPVAAAQPGTRSGKTSPSPKPNLQRAWEEVCGWGIHPPGANPFPAGEHPPSDPCVRFLHVRVAPVQYPSSCWQRCALCSRVVCLQSHITLTKSKEEIYLLYFAFRQLCPGTVAPILIDYTAIFLNFSSK